MRFLRESVLAAAVLSVYGVAQAFIGARELESVPPTTVQPKLPISNALGLAGFALTVVVYALLGRAVARAGAAPSTAAARGAVVGLAAGIASSLAQAALQQEFFHDVALSYGLPDAFAQLMLLGIVIVGPLAGACVGAVLAWLAALLLRPRRDRTPA